VPKRQQHGTTTPTINWFQKQQQSAASEKSTTSVTKAATINWQ